MELEALDITDEPLELEGADEVENEELTKKLLDEQGESSWRRRVLKKSLRKLKTVINY